MPILVGLVATLLACPLSVRSAAADGMTWTLRSSSGQTLSLAEPSVGDGDLYFHNDVATLPSGKIEEADRLDWSRNRLTGNRGPVTVSVGRQEFQGQSLVWQGMARPGVSLRVGGASEASRLTLFVLPAGETADPHPGLALSDPADRLVGTRLFLGGEKDAGLPLNATVSVVNGPGGLSAWSLAASGKVVGPFHLEGEVAGAENPLRGPGSALAVHGGVAAGGWLPYVPVHYQLHLDWQRIGSRFASPAFPGEEANVERSHFQGGLSWWAFELQTDAERKRENVDRLAGLSRGEVWQISVDVTLHPQMMFAAIPLPFFLEHPVWKVYHHRSRRRNFFSGGELVDARQGEDSGLSLAFGSSPCSWEFDWNLATREDLAQETSRTRQLGLKAFVDVGSPTFQVNPFFNLTHSADIEGVEVQGMTTGLAGIYRPKAPWKGNLTFSMSRQQSRDLWNESLQIQGGLGWRATSGKAGNPGIEVHLDGGYQAASGQSDGQQEGRVLLSLKLPISS